MNKNNKGFTLIELIVSFSLTMMIIIVLFEIIFLLKEVYEKSGLKTELLNHQNILIDKIYTDLNEDILLSIDDCEDDCVVYIALLTCYSFEGTRICTYAEWRTHSPRRSFP